MSVSDTGRNERPQALSAAEVKSRFAYKSKASRADSHASYVKEPRVFLLPVAAKYAANPTQLVLLSQILHWFLSPSKRVDRRGNRISVSGEVDTIERAESRYRLGGDADDSDPDAKPLVKLSHRYRRRHVGSASEYLEAKPLDRIKRRARGRTAIELPDGGEDWRWSVTLPYARWAADCGLSVRQVRSAMQALASTGWFILQHNSKREPIVIEGERMRDEAFVELLDEQAEGKRPGLLLYVRNINQVCQGDIVAAIVLKQVMRLMEHHKKQSIYQSAEQLGKLWKLEDHQVARAKAKLANIGVLVVEKAKWVGEKGKRRKASSMSVNWQRFDELRKS